MTDLTQVIRWNTGFIRGLAQSVLDRAKVVRTSLTEFTEEAPKMAVKVATDAMKAAGVPTPSKTAKKSTAKKSSGKSTVKRAARKPSKGKKNLNG